MFIASHHDRKSDKIVVWEKSETGKRITRSYDSPYDFYVPDQNGPFKAVTGIKLSKLTFSNKREFDEACRSHPLRFESDISPQEKVMMSYFGKKVPILNVGYIDIEVDYDPNVGFSSPSNAYAPINAITLYRSDIKTYITLAVAHQDWKGSLPDNMLEDNYFLYRSERELLENFFVWIEDCDVLTGWNSEFFDLPYIGKRIELLFGQSAIKRLAFPDGPAPRWGEKDRFKGATKKELVLELGSRIHLDYMALFKKFTLGGRQSYSLASITEDELDVPKLKYEGTLAELYQGTYRPNLNSIKPEKECDDLYRANVEREQIRQEIERRGLSVT